MFLILPFIVKDKISTSYQNYLLVENINTNFKMAEMDAYLNQILNLAFQVS